MGCDMDVDAGPSHRPQPEDPLEGHPRYKYGKMLAKVSLSSDAPHYGRGGHT